MRLQRKHGDLVFGFIILAFGILYLALCTQITIKPSDALNSAFVPYILGVLLLVISCFQIIRGIGAMKKADADDTPMGEGIDGKTVTITMLLLVAYIAVLPFLGFILATMVYLFVQFVVSTPDADKKRYGVYAAISIISGVGVYLIFRYGLDLMLPQGLLTFI